MRLSSSSWLLISVLLSTVNGLSLTLNSADSVKAGTKLLVGGMLDYYPGASSNAQTKASAEIGDFQAPYYWWESGVAWGIMVDYQFITGDTSYQEMIKKSLEVQAGTDGNYMPSDQSLTEGNDDQGFWGIAAMNAAERNFTNPDSNYKGWLYTAQAVFNLMTQRWDTQHCGGGLRWQIYTWNSGYDYKNSVSNGAMFNIASRLARYTGNSSYADWAEKIFTWMLTADFIDRSNGDAWIVYDGAGIANNCTDFSKAEWTYNFGLLLEGSAYMYDYSNGSAVWETRATDLWNRAKAIFFENGIMYEQACQDRGVCNNDQRCFKGIFGQCLGHTALFIPSLTDSVMSLLNSSATAAAASCSGGTDGHTCGLNWFSGYDNNYGLGEEISALGVILNTQILSRPKPYTAVHGGSSKGSANAGSSSESLNPLADNEKVTGGDKAGAAIVTIVLMLCLIGIGWWMLI